MENIIKFEFLSEELQKGLKMMRNYCPKELHIDIWKLIHKKYEDEQKLVFEIDSNFEVLKTAISSFRLLKDDNWMIPVRPRTYMTTINFHDLLTKKKTQGNEELDEWALLNEYASEPVIVVESGAGSINNLKEPAQELLLSRFGKTTVYFLMTKSAKDIFNEIQLQDIKVVNLRTK